MATENAAAIQSSVQTGQKGLENWNATESITATDEQIFHFIGATGDSQKPHLDDEAARSLPFKLKGRVLHAALVRDIAVNFLIQRHLAQLLKVEETHAAMDQGGGYEPLHPVYPHDQFYVRYAYSGRYRRQGSFPVSIKYEVLVRGDQEDLLVMRGAQEALLVYYRSPRG